MWAYSRHQSLMMVGARNMPTWDGDDGGGGTVEWWYLVRRSPTELYLPPPPPPPHLPMSLLLTIVSSPTGAVPVSDQTLDQTLAYLTRSRFSFDHRQNSVDDQ
jgi:hypothetical protein